MPHSIAVVGAGVSGLTSALFFAERGSRVEIFADETGEQTTSAAAAAIWFPYDAEPATKVIPWALETFTTLAKLAAAPLSGVSMIELRQFCRVGSIKSPQWANSLGARRLSREVLGTMPFVDGYALKVPLTDTTIYLDYLARRFLAAGGRINANVHLKTLEEIDRQFDLILNCAGFGAQTLVPDNELEPHRGQVAVAKKIAGLSCAIVCDDPPLMYAIPRANDCVLGGTNDISDNRKADPAATDRILAECSLALKINRPPVIAERVGLRPFRRSGVRLERSHLRDGRTVIHNYGHGGSGFTLSWGCARTAFVLANP